jgi:hypothetical protein
VYGFLELLECILDHCKPGDKPLAGYERARHSGALNEIAGLVYLDPKRDRAGTSGNGCVAINTGVQRLLRNLDEMPMPDAGYRLLEPPHRRKTLSPHPYPAHKVGKLSSVSSIVFLVANLNRWKSGRRRNHCFPPTAPVISIRR